MTIKGIYIDRVQAVAAAEMAVATARETRKQCRTVEMAQDKRKSGKATKDIHKAEETAQGRY